jgi:hypothetical protein
MKRAFGRATGSYVLIAFVVALLASTADARVFRMSGKWLQQRGVIAEIPLFGGIPNAKNGPGGGTFVSAMGSAPATLTVPAGAFTGVNRLPAIALPGITLVQLSTQFSFFGPSAPEIFVAGPKLSRPANFTFCPGAAANPSCTTPQAGGAQGTFPGLVKYTAGAEQFGGTMQMLIAGMGGSVSVVVGLSPTRIQHNPLGGGTGPAVPQEVGGAYGNTNTNLLVAGPITTGAVCATGPCAGDNGVIIVPGVPDGTGGTSTNTITGFPWTTGMISAIVTTKLPTTNSSLTGTGSDNRSALGAGNITLVAGGIARRRPSNANFPSIDTVTMTIRPQNLPTMSPGGLAALATVILLGAGYASRKRWSRGS